MRVKKLSAKNVLQAIQDALEDAKAKDVVMLDVSKISDFTDYMVVASGTSNRHVSSVADRVVDKLRELGLRPIGVEGQKTGDWVLVDFGDVVVHVMREQVRDFYNLEKLWSDAKGLEIKKPSEIKMPKAPRKKAKGAKKGATVRKKTG
jgi:ribosome-associated protein